LATTSIGLDWQRGSCAGDRRADPGFRALSRQSMSSHPRDQTAYHEAGHAQPQEIAATIANLARD
jgi:hypothetical protein